MADKSKAAKQREVARFLRERDRARLRELREGIKKARARRRAAIAAAVAWCREELGQERRELDIQAKRYAGKKARATAAERRAESDDEVRRNIPAELVGLFNKVKRDIRGSARMSRTEAFMKWAEDNPEEVLTAQEWAAERDVARLVKEYEAQERKMRSRKRYARPAEEISAELAKEEDEEVPF